MADAGKSKGTGEEAKVPREFEYFTDADADDDDDDDDDDE